jgi:hypothetical protein
VTCGGLCPGMNSVIREIVQCLYRVYGVTEVWGIQYGYAGFYEEQYRHPLMRTAAAIDPPPDSCDDIHRRSFRPIPCATSTPLVARSLVPLVVRRPVSHAECGVRRTLTWRWAIRSRRVRSGEDPRWRGKGRIQSSICHWRRRNAQGRALPDRGDSARRQSLVHRIDD